MKHLLPLFLISSMVTGFFSPREACGSEREDLLIAIQGKNPAKVRGIISANPAMVKTLLTGRAEDGRPVKGVPLYWAARDGSAEMVEFLLDQGSDVNTTNSLGFSPLHAAVAKGKKDIMTLLISRGASVATRECDMGFTPLHTAAGRGYLQFVQVLLSAGADLNAKGLQNGPCTPLDFTIGRLYLSNEPYSPARYETIKYLRGLGAQASGRLARLPDIRGEVLDSTNIQKLMCTVSLGSRDGLAPGDSLSIQRSGSEIATGRISILEQGSGMMILTSAPAVFPAQGDTVMLLKKGPVFQCELSADERQEIDALTSALQRRREQVAQYLEKTTVP